MRIHGTRDELAIIHAALRDLKVFSGRSHPALAEEICKYLETPQGHVTLYSFSDGEHYVQIDENVRGADVFIIQPTCPPSVNDHLMELLIMLDAFKRSSAKRVTAVVPYYGYARQDRKDKPRVPITAKLAADLISTAGADRVLTLDLHAAQIQGFFNIPVDHLFAAPVIVNHLRSLEMTDVTIVSPDAGGVERARAYAKRLGASLAIIDKRRFAKNQTEVMNIIGEVEGRNVFIVDDIIDTAGTLIHSVQALREQGAKSISAACTHAVLSGPAIQRINTSQLDAVITTNSIPTEDKQAECPKLKTLSIASLLAEAIKRIHNEDSVSSLFEM
ncbi:MAG TPA: ribose-phosphate pyrophosphokinase [Thermoanaerobaculia bacterium]|nr:ribose-phosphate pyrophosphokinase [Thermoanaerobaculia bacterium]